MLKQKGIKVVLVGDSFTGKTRPCNSLSGGETFMASISLALAISDTIQSRKSGINIDSLFIDEGFGSLDENSLEQAISILDEIRDSRKIGIISHVGDLKSRIKSSIEIEKTQSGSKIILI
jgi:exonuclease SbcC